MDIEQVVAAFRIDLARLNTFANFLEERFTTCPICQNTVNDPRKTTCNHIFCEECISRWLTQRARSTCPTCRSAAALDKLRAVVLDEVPAPDEVTAPNGFTVADPVEAPLVQREVRPAST